MVRLAVLLSVLLALMMALGQMRDNRRRGIAINWTKTLVTGFGVIATTALAFAALSCGERSGERLSGVVLFGLVFLIGITIVVAGVNRIWPSSRG